MAVYALDDDVPDIHPDAYVHPEAVVIGQVQLGPGASVWPGAVLRGDHGRIVVGARTSVQDGTVVHTTPSTPTVVGDDCVVGHNVHMEGCTVGNRVLVGSGSIVLNFAEVGDDAVVAAGAVVAPRTKVPANATAMGVPATITEGKGSGKFIEYAVDVYLELQARHKAGLRRID